MYAIFTQANPSPKLMKSLNSCSQMSKINRASTNNLNFWGYVLKSYHKSAFWNSKHIFFFHRHLLACGHILRGPHRDLCNAPEAESLMALFTRKNCKLHSRTQHRVAAPQLTSSGNRAHTLSGPLIPQYPKPVGKYKPRSMVGISAQLPFKHTNSSQGIYKAGHVCDFLLLSQNSNISIWLLTWRRKQTKEFTLWDF